MHTVDTESAVNNRVVAVYGSLKKGKYNHHMMQGCKFIGDTTIRGTLYSLGSYPAIIMDDDNEYPAEVYEMPDELYERVRRMEIGAGYKEVTMDLDVETESNTVILTDIIVYYADKELEEYCITRAKEINEY